MKPDLGDKIFKTNIILACGGDALWALTGKKEIKDNFLRGLGDGFVYTVQLVNNNNTASLDRINSNIGYVVNNIQWVYKDINYMKFKLSNDKFIYYCKLIANNYANFEPSYS